jgi:uncharacterized protein (DUF1501 family)
MDRREFLKAAVLASMSSVMPLNSWAATTSANASNKKLVIVLLRGAVDGLSVVVPVGDRDYYAARPNIAIPQPKGQGGAIDLDGYFALNPALAPMMDLWSGKKLAFVHACGSPDPTRSHFDAQDYMESGEPGIKSASTGWLDRLLQVLPENNSPVRAINFGPTIPRIFSGCNNVANVAVARKGGGKAGDHQVTDRPQLAQMFGQIYQDDPMLSGTFSEGIKARETILSDLSQGTMEDQKEMEAANRGAAPPQAAFGKQVATLLLKEPNTQVAFIAFGGWDTHVNQGNEKGQLANKLTALGAGLADFYRSLGSHGDDVTTLVMSEFGRTAHENGNRGTDHGHGNVMWLIGGGVCGGKVYGQWKGLNNSSLYENRDVPVTTDFRSVVSAVLRGPMQIRDTSKIFPGFEYDPRLEKVVNA